MKHSVGFRTSLGFITRAVILSYSFVLCCDAATTSSFPVITASGQRVDSVFDGLTPSQQVRDTLIFKSKTPGIQNLTHLGSLNIGHEQASTTKAEIYKWLYAII